MSRSKGSTWSYKCRRTSPLTKEGEVRFKQKKKGSVSLYTCISVLLYHIFSNITVEIKNVELYEKEKDPPTSLPKEGRWKRSNLH